MRTELLKALGQAFKLDGASETDGKTTFSADFMDKLEELIGPAFNRADFGIKRGEVKSGKPLTQRRITAIVNAACAKGKPVQNKYNIVLKLPKDAASGFYRLEW